MNKKKPEVIIEDTRQKAEKHEIKHEGFKKLGIEVYRSKLPIGDYMLPPPIIIDTKQDITELSENLCGSKTERERFHKQLRRAAKWRTRLVILVEDDRLDDFEALKGASIQHPAGHYFSGDRILEEMDRCSEEFGTEFRLCAKKDSAAVIREILHQYDGLYI